MKLLGFEITRQKALQTISDRGGGWWPVVREYFAGAWQQNLTINRDTVMSYSAVYACVSLIAQDIGKMRIKLVQRQTSGIWKETTSPAFSPVLRKPNHYQTRVKFFEWWITSKLVHGNTYALKRRDNRGVVTGLYLLDPTRVSPLVSDQGDVFYKLHSDNLSGLEDEVIVPAREMIHDPAVCLFHPLMGMSPIYACGLAATQGIRIQTNSTKFFGNMSRPSGILTAPGAIADETATRLKDAWGANYGGDNVGKTAVLGDGLKYEPIHVNAVDSQLIEQLKWTAENVCTCFHVPAYMIGVGPMPAYNNIEALNQQYYSQCLQSLIEAAELALDEGLELPSDYGTEFDLDSLLRMDTATRYKSHSDAIAGGWLSPNEARRKEDYEPVEGGDSPMVQQQNYSLAALAKRDAQEDPFASKTAPALPVPETDEEDPDEEAREMIDTVVRGLSEAVHV
jgi:HK97 family phage portal protein